MSITRGSERNSRRYRRTARASGASGVPRLISNNPGLRASAFTSTPRTRHPSHSSVERVREGERELRDPRLETLSRLELRLLPHHPFTPNLLHPAIGIGDDPVTAPQLRRTFTDVGDLHRVHEGE